MIVRPWKPPVKAMTPERPVAARAIFTAFSVASAPVVKNTDLSGSEIGASALSRSARASDDYTDAYPAALRQFQHSCGSKRSQMPPRACQSASKVRASALRKCALILAKACSTGFMSGL